MPKFAVLVAASKESETGIHSTSELAEMGRFNDKLRAIGALVNADGFLNSDKGARITFGPDGPSKPQYGPFDIEGLVAGYWIWELESMEEAIKWANQIPFKFGRVEIRKVASDEDFEKDLRP